MLGDARTEKGGALVSALVPAHADWRWLIQGHAAAWRNLPTSPNVERVEAELSPDGYHALFARAGVVLLAYDPARLALRTSGVAAEAIAAGRPLVATHHTWAAEQILAGRASGVVFPLHTVASCAEGLSVALERFDTLAESAARLAPAWRATQCAASFLDRIWAGATAPIAVPPPL